MIFIEKTEVYGWEAAIRGMRNSYNSWDKSDSSYSSSGKYELGNADIELMDITKRSFAREIPALYQCNNGCYRSKILVGGNGHIQSGNRAQQLLYNA